MVVIDNRAPPKKPPRCDALGMIVVIALLICRLMRLNLAQEEKVLPGWDNKPTDHPTSFMMSKAFYGIQVTRTIAEESLLLNPISDRQMQFLALGFDQHVFLDKSAKCVLQCRGKGDD